MPRPTFIDVHPTYAASEAYKCTNEEPMLQRQLLGNQRFNKAGGIASSGEVLLSVLLPRSKSVFAIDHGYGSLSACFIKMIMLDTLGPRAMKALLFEKPYKEFLAAAGRAAVELPTSLAGKLRFDGPNPYPTISVADYMDLRREWINFPDAMLETVRRKMEVVTLIHGDLRDLSQFGQMDCLYVSNAVQGGHNNRDGKSPDLAYVAPLVRKGGLMLMARGTSSPILPANQHWTHQRRVLATRLHWNYDLYMRTAIDAPIVPVVVPNA